MSRPTSSYPSRRSTRLRGYDYSQPGAYFVTLCIEQRLPLLGSIVEGEAHLSPAGAMVADVWGGLGDHYPGVSVDAYIVMPNHLHGILVLFDPVASRQPNQHGLSLSTVIQRFKTYTAHLYGPGVRTVGWPPYPGRLWQHRFHEHVIRNERDLEAIRTYIANNPLQWQLDRENPDRRPAR
ncbi:MAG TPA: transposase [Chloroflexota bacterium]|nr:transposase [Chloroflexota bacterium]